jgi:hypothetical protein
LGTGYAPTGRDAKWMVRFRLVAKQHKEAFMYKETKILEEKLERATTAQIARLSQQIAKDPELRRMLTTPMGEIPQYQYLYTLKQFNQHCLFDAIQLFDMEHRPNFYFSKIGNEFT